MVLRVGCLHHPAFAKVQAERAVRPVLRRVLPTKAVVHTAVRERLVGRHVSSTYTKAVTYTGSQVLLAACR